MRPDYEKIFQMINFFALKNGKSIDKLTCLKIIWMADRYHLRMFGRSITNSNYLAMQFGPVSSESKNAFEFTRIPAACKKYGRQYLEPAATNQVKSILPVDKDVFSETDLEAMEVAWKTYQRHKRNIVGFTHKFPEWKKHEAELQKQKKVPMDMLDFFSAADPDYEYCSGDAERVRLNRNLFEEMRELY